MDDAANDPNNDPTRLGVDLGLRLEPAETTGANSNESTDTEDEDDG